MTGPTAPFRKVFVAGAGAWGTALATVLHRAGVEEVTLWSRNQEVVTAINQHHENRPYLPAIPLPADLQATTDLQALATADAMLCVIPAQHLRAQLPRLRAARGKAPLPVALCSKGIEQGSGLLMHQLLQEAWPEARAAVLSGPSFAVDVAAGQPTAVTLADQDPVRGRRWLATLATPQFRPYYTDDVLGVELGGALKNVLAIACGVVEGLGLGESARAALMTRGFAEAARFAAALGARPETLQGLSGLGDLILTCSSRQSRNMSLGYEMGQGRPAAAILAERRSVAEGAATAPVVLELAAKAGVEMPVVAAVVALLEGRPPVEVVERLLARPLRDERED